jgi:methionyl aminopeptidase
VDEEVVSKYLKAGDIAWRVKQFLYSYVKPGMKLLELANTVENMIRELGGEPAFPINISINSIAAHKTPLLDEVDSAITEDDVVKIDIGVHVDGYIADTAITLCYNDKLNNLVEASKEALEKSLKVINEGVRFSAVGKVVEETAKKYGFKPIRNLGGHSLDRYVIHAGDVIPNYGDVMQLGKFRRGMAYAIEPFISTGNGYVVEGSEVSIYALSKTKFKGLTTQEVHVVNYILSRFKTLPFCERWFSELGFSLNNLRIILYSLKLKNMLSEYPVLIESLPKAYISQFEETVLITSKEVIITTNPTF